MNRSAFEEIGDVQLYFLLKMIDSKYDINNVSSESFEDKNFGIAFEESCDSIGVTVDDYYLDMNYIISLMIKNRHVNLDTSRYSGQRFERPVIGVYSFDVDEDRTEFVRRTYQHRYPSYSEDLLFPMIDKIDNDGNFDYYEGKETNTDYYDGNTNEVIIDRTSLRKLKL